MRRLTMLKKLLNYVIAKYVRHELECIWNNLLEYKLFFLAIRSFQFLLDKSRTVLISTKLNNVSNNILE